MFNAEEFDRIRKDRGIMLSKIAKTLGLSYASLGTRLRGKISFSVDEVKKIQKLLNLTDDEVLKIFFGK